MYFNHGSVSENSRNICYMIFLQPCFVFTLNVVHNINYRNSFCIYVILLFETENMTMRATSKRYYELKDILMKIHEGNFQN